MLSSLLLRCCAVLQVYDVSRAAQCCCGSLVLSAGASLAWLGFSREGLLAAMDRCGEWRHAANRRNALHRLSVACACWVRV
jgi:hypothetical protein